MVLLIKMLTVYILFATLLFLAAAALESDSVLDKNLEECFAKQLDYEAQAQATMRKVQNWDTVVTAPVIHTYIRSDANLSSRKRVIQSAQESIKIEGRSGINCNFLRSRK